MRGKRNLLVVFLFVLFSGCGLWTNFTTYFNTYYNASQSFEQALANVEKGKKELFAFKDEKISSTASKLFDDVIEKCSKILQFHAESSYLDESLLMLGKSFYYKQDYSKALRKFNELTLRNSEELQLENRLWIGRSQLQLREFETGLKLLDEVIKDATNNEEIEIVTEALLTEVRFYLFRDEVPKAIELIYELLKVSDDEVLNAEVNYELGKIHLERNNLDEAAAAFAEAQNWEPTFDIEFNSKLEYAKIKRLQGENEEGLDLLLDLSNSDKYEELWDKVDLEIAEIYFNQGKIEDALDIYMEIDSVYSKTESAGYAAFRLGQIFETYVLNYDSALFYYNKCLAAKSPDELKKESRTKTNVIGDYIDIQEKLFGQYKQLDYLTDPDSFIRDSLLYEDQRREDSVKNASQYVGNTSRRRGNYSANPAIGKKKFVKPLKPKITADSLKTLISEVQYEMGNLFFGELNVPDSAYFYYTKSLSQNPNSLNKPYILFAIGNYYLTVDNQHVADSLFQFIYDNYKYDRIVNEAAKKIGQPGIDFDSDPAEPEYLIGEESYLNNQYDEAINKFLSIYKENPDSPFAPKSLYTAAFILENDLDMLDSAAVFYDSLFTKYPATDYSKSIKKKITFYRGEQRKAKAHADSVQKAFDDSLKTIEDSLKALLTPDSSAIDSMKLPVESNIPDSSLQDRSEEYELMKALNGKARKEKINDTTGVLPSTNNSINKKPIKDSLNNSEKSAKPHAKASNPDSLLMKSKKDLSIPKQPEENLNKGVNKDSLNSNEKKSKKLTDLIFKNTTKLKII